MFKEITKKYPKILIFPTFIFLLVLILTAFKINGSSVEMYNRSFLGDNYKDSNMLFGKARPIRSDEWAVETPLTISQTKVQLAEKNKLVGLGQEMAVLSDAPTRHWSTIFKPQNWPFFALSDEYAFAFKWWFRGFLLIVGSYFLIFKLTRGSYLLAIGASLFMFFTPFVQWWYSTTVVETFAFFFLSFFAFIKLYDYKNIKDIAIYSVLLVYFSLCFIFLLYPPFQIPLFWLGLFFLFGYVLNEKQNLNRKRLPHYLVALVLIATTTLAVVGAYYLSFRDIIQTIQHTSYPGNRQVVSGGYTLLNFFSGFFNILLQKNHQVPAIWGNQSEASSSLMLFPFILPITLSLIIKGVFKKEKIDFILILLSIFVLLMLTWMILWLPNVVGKLLFITTIPHNRLIVSLVAANIIFIFYFLARVKIQKNLDYKITALILAVFAFIIHFSFGLTLKTSSPTFLSSIPVIFLISGVVFVLTYLLLIQEKVLFLTIFILYSVASTFIVNPLYHGLSPIISSPVSRELEKVQSSNTDSSRWVVYDSILLGNYLLANNIASLDSVHLYPQNQLWHYFDKDEKYRNIWNRYAHVTFTSNLADKVDFVLNQEDVFTVKVNPCNKIFKDLKVEYFVLGSKSTDSCLNEVREINYTFPQLFIYKRID